MEREEAKHSTDHAMARSQAKGSPGQPDQLSTAGLYRLSDRVQLREVWVQQASLLIQQVHVVRMTRPFRVKLETQQLCQ